MSHTRESGFIGLMMAVLSSEGIISLENHLNYLERIANKIVSGKVPLRATPTVKKATKGSRKKGSLPTELGKKQREEGKPEKVKCVRCGALETKSKATHIVTQGWVCEKCDRELTQDIMRDMKML